MLFQNQHLVPDTIPGLTGQIAASFVPFGADLRDYFANILVNEDTGAAILNAAGFLTDFFAVAGVSVDVVKVSPKVGKFVSKFSKDAAKVFDSESQWPIRFENNKKCG